MFHFRSRDRRHRHCLDLDVCARLISVDLQEHIADAQRHAIVARKDDLGLPRSGSTNERQGPRSDRVTNRRVGGPTRTPPDRAPARSGTGTPERGSRSSVGRYMLSSVDRRSEPKPSQMENGSHRSVSRSSANPVRAETPALAGVSAARPEGLESPPS